MFKQRNMINHNGTMHPLLRAGHFNNYIGKYLNPNLYKLLCPFENDTKNSLEDIEASKLFATTYGVSNLGELMDAFGDRYIVNDIVDIRTLLYFITNAINKDTSTDYYVPRYGYKEKIITQSYETHQLRRFYKEIKNLLVNKYDFITAATLLQAPGFISEGENEYLLEILYLTFEELLSFTLPFEETVYGVFACISCLNEMRNANQPYTQESVLKESLAVAIDSTPMTACTNIEDTSVYLMLAYILETEEEYRSSKNFENKVNYKLMKKVLSMTKKYLKPDEMKEACEFIGISTDIGRYLNFLAYQNLEFMSYKVMRSQLPQSTGSSIKNELALFLEQEQRLPEFIFSVIDAAVTRQISYKEEPLSTVISNFFTKIYSGTISKANLDIVVERYQLHTYEDFMKDNRWAHLLHAQSIPTIENTPVQSHVVENTPVRDFPVIEHITTQPSIAKDSTIESVSSTVNIPSIENTQNQVTQVHETIEEIPSLQQRNQEPPQRNTNTPSITIEEAPIIQFSNFTIIPVSTGKVRAF